MQTLSLYRIILFLIVLSLSAGVSYSAEVPKGALGLLIEPTRQMKIGYPENQPKGRDQWKLADSSPFDMGPHYDPEGDRWEHHEDWEKDRREWEKDRWEDYRDWEKDRREWEKDRWEYYKELEKDRREWEKERRKDRKEGMKKMEENRREARKKFKERAKEAHKKNEETAREAQKKAEERVREANKN